MKLQWKAPTLEVLDVKETMLDPVNGEFLDKTYPDGTPRNKLGYS